MKERGLSTSKGGDSPKGRRGGEILKKSLAEGALGNLVKFKLRVEV